VVDFVLLGLGVLASPGHHHLADRQIAHRHARQAVEFAFQVRPQGRFADGTELARTRYRLGAVSC
jgi:hypothetical protein